MARWFEYRRRIERIIPEPSPRERFREAESRLQPPAERRPIGYLPGRGGIFSEPAYDLSDLPPRMRHPDYQPPNIGVDPRGIPIGPGQIPQIIPPEVYQGTDIPSQPFGREAEVAANQRRLLLREGGPSGLRSLPIDFPGRYEVVRDAPALAPRPGESVIPIPGSTDVLLQRSYGDALSPTSRAAGEVAMNVMDAAAFLSGRGIQSVVEAPVGLAPFGGMGGQRTGNVEKALSPEDFELAYEGAFRRGENREDFEKAVQELGFGYMFAGGILQPDLLIPGWGFTKADDVSRAVSTFARAGRAVKGETALAKAIRESAEGAHLLENMRLTDITLRGGGDVGGARLADIAAPAAADITERTIPTARELAEIPVARTGVTETNLAAGPVEVTAAAPVGPETTAARTADDIATELGITTTERPRAPRATGTTYEATTSGGKVEYHIPDDNSELYIVNIGTEEQRRGLGTQLVDYVSQIAQERNIPRITASLNTEGGVRVTNKLPNARFFDGAGNEVTFDQAIDLARAGRGPQLEANVSGRPIPESLLGGTNIAPARGAPDVRLAADRPQGMDVFDARLIRQSVGEGRPDLQKFARGLIRRANEQGLYRGDIIRAMDSLDPLAIAQAARRAGLSRAEINEIATQTATTFGPPKRFGGSMLETSNAPRDVPDVRLAAEGEEATDAARLRGVSPEGVMLKDHIPNRTRLEGQLRQANDEIASAVEEVESLAGKRGVTAARNRLIEAEAKRGKIEAQLEIDTITTSGRPIDEQFTEIQSRLDALHEEQMDLYYRNIEADAIRTRGPGKQALPFGDPERKVLERGQPSAANRRLDAQRRAAIRDQLREESHITDAQAEVYEDFLDDARFEPVRGVSGEEFTAVFEGVERAPEPPLPAARAAAEAPQAPRAPSTTPTRHTPVPETSVSSEPVQEAPRAVEAATEVTPPVEAAPREGPKRAARLAGLSEDESDEFTRLLGQDSLTPEEAARLDDFEGRVADIGSPPPPKTPDIPAGVAEPPGESGFRFVAPLRPLDDVVAEVETVEGVGRVQGALRQVSARTGINPSLLETSDIGRALVAWERQRVSIDELVKVTAGAAMDPHRQPFTGRSPFRIGQNARVSGVRIPEGMSDAWMDVFSRYKSYDLNPKQRAMVEDFLQVVEETEMMRRAAGLDPRTLHETLEDVFYVPRQVVKVKGVEIPVPSKPGLMRYYEEAIEGIAKGIQYDAEPRHVLELHLRSAYREILESQMDDVLDPISVTARQVLEKTKPGVVKNVEAAVRDYKRIRRMVRREIKDAQKALARPAKTEGQVMARQRDLARLELLRKTRDVRVKAVKQKLDRARDIYRREMQSARNRRALPGHLFGQDQEMISVQQWRNKYFPLDDAQRLSDAMGSFAKTTEGQNIIGRGFEILGNQMRFLSAVGDFAAPFIHGQPLLFTDPVAWSRATAHHYYAWLDPTSQGRFIKNHIEAFHKMARYGTPIGDPEFFAALERGRGVSPGKLLEILPKGDEARRLAQEGGRQTFGRFQASYNTFLGDSRALLTEALTGQAPDAEVQAYIRNLTGGLNSRALGVGPTQRGVESTWLAFSPRLFRSTAALIGDAAKLGTTWRSRRAIRSLASLAAGATGIYIATGLALGKDWNTIKDGLNPLNGKRFLSHQIEGDWIGAGGQIRAITQIIAKTGQALVTGETDLYKVNSDNPIVQGLLSRGAPGLRVAQATGEFATGADLLSFERIDSLPDLMLFYGRSSLPFAIQGKLSGESWLTSGAGLIGARTSAETTFERRNSLYDRIAAEKYKVIDTPAGPLVVPVGDPREGRPAKYDDLDSAAKSQVKDDERAIELAERARDELEAGGGEFGEAVTESRFQSDVIDNFNQTGKVGDRQLLPIPIGQSDTAFLAGQIDVETWREREGDYQTVLRTLRAAGQLRLEYGDDEEEQNQVDKLLDAYFEVVPTDPKYTDQFTGEVDWERYFLAKDNAYNAAVRIGGSRVADFLRPESDRPVKNMERQAREAYDRLPSRWKGTSKEDSKRLSEFSRAVEDLQNQLATEGVNGQRFKIRENTIANWLATQPPWSDPTLAESFIFLQSFTNRQEFTDPAYDTYLTANREELELFFPWLYGPSFFERIGELEEFPGLRPRREPTREERPRRETREEAAQRAYEESILQELTR